MNNNDYDIDIDGDKKRKEPASYWQERIEEADLEEKDWRRSARIFKKMYLNERYPNEYGDDFNMSRGNIIFSNVQMFMASILPEVPDPVIQARHTKQNVDDPAEKSFYNTIADIVQRAIVYVVQDMRVKKAVEEFKEDVLVCGRGVLWVTYDATLADNGYPSDEKIDLRHVPLSDYRQSPARNWREVWWVARRILLTKKEVGARFGEDKLKELSETFPNTEDIENKENKSTQYEPRVEVWEIWDKRDKKVIFMSPGLREGVLQEYEDPYKLENFFPTSEPLRAIATNKSMTPISEIRMYAREALEIQECADRQSNLMRGIKARAFVPTQYVKDIKKINEAQDNEYVPIEVAMGMIDKGGLEQIVMYEPIQDRAGVMGQLAEHAESLMQKVYKITGMSDAMQVGDTYVGAGGDAETATKTIMKGKFGSVRLQKKQELFNDYVKETYSIIAEVISTMFSKETLSEMTSIKLPSLEEKNQFTQLPPDQMQQMTADQKLYIARPSWEEILLYLKEKKLSRYLLDVETEMNVWESDAETQQTRINCFRAIIENVQMILPVLEQMPSMITPLILMLGFVIDSFRMPSSSRNALDDSFRAMESDVIAKANQPPAPAKPTMEEVELEKAKAMQVTAQSRMAEVETTAQAKQTEAQIRMQEAQGNLQAEQMIQQGKMHDIALKDEMARMKNEIEKMKLMLEEKKLQIEALKDKTGNDVKLEIGKMQQETNLIKADKEADLQKERSYENAELAREKMQAQSLNFANKKERGDDE